METTRGRETAGNLVVTATAQQRLIGEYNGRGNGPVVIFIGGIHGNEPAAVIALEKVLRTIRQSKPPFRGTLAAIKGNVAALARSVRFIEEDLNRIWTPERMAQLNRNGSASYDETAERREQRELFQLLQTYFRNKQNPIYLIDLHTTSAESAPFAVLADTIRNRRLALRLHAPLILGLEELLEGTIMHYAGDLGFCTLSFESGQHNQEASVDNHVAAIWLLLTGAGCMARESVPGYENHNARLNFAARDLPRVFEIKLRYGIREGEDFRMQPGYKNFQPISRGELLANNREGEIRSDRKGNIFMPLYQSQGNDGYFIIGRVRYFWLKISEWLRKLHIDKLLPLLPGIQRNPGTENEFIVNLKIARWYAPEILHLLGYRKNHREKGRLIVARRKCDIRGPEMSNR